MGRTLLGVDLDESAVGGLVERLLTDEELEMLADGGRPGDDPGEGEAATDGGTDADDDQESASDATDDESDQSTDASDTPPESDVTADDATHLSSASGAVTGADAGSVEGGRRVPSVGPASEERRPAGDETHMGDTEGENGNGGGLARFKPLLVKGAVALVVLAVIGVVLWKYGGKIRSKLPAKLGGTSGESESGPGSEGAESASADVSPARRRAKASAATEARAASEKRDDTHMGATEGESDEGRDGTESDRERSSPPTAGATDGSADVGALVGLGLLALVAAIVRKFGEKPPRDPLVEGAQDEE